MAYCTQSDIEKLISTAELAQLTAESGGTPDAAVVAEAIAAADAEIDSYLLVRYQLPLSTVPARVKGLSVDMAIYKLCLRRSLKNVNEARRQAYEDAVKFLQLVARGLAVIEGANGAEPAGQVQDVTEINSQTRVMSRDTLKDW